ncbi:SH3 domain-containing protein, partial [Streptomyces europaeiscabiei]
MTTPGFLPSHVVPPGGLPAWEAPDPSYPTVALDALLPVRLLERRGDWGHVLCANGWSAWIDGRLLVAVPQDPPAAGADAA